MKIGKTGHSILKLCHMLFAAIWIGAGISLLFIIIYGLIPGDINGVLKAMNIIDMFVIIPAVVGLLVTGILFSTLTNWGFVKHRWIVVKYVINLLPLIFGGVVMAPPLTGMMKIAGQYGQQALTNPEFIHYKMMFLVPLYILIILALLAFVLSVFKPALGRKG
ncbi:MAG TPA: DUF2269 family protein [Syntrophomonas sp.]|nr:DUF2269 family protein [Syntrophomonas sp.]